MRGLYPFSQPRQYLAEAVQTRFQILDNFGGQIIGFEQVIEIGRALVQWKNDTGDHHRRLAENVLYRLKQLFGERIASRQFDAQVNEVHARIAAMNRMTYLGMPVSVRVGIAVS